MLVRGKDVGIVVEFGVGWVELGGLEKLIWEGENKLDPAPLEHRLSIQSR
jgi:hypothetical protein